MRRLAAALPLAFALAFLSTVTPVRGADPVSAPRPAIAIIIDDLGYRPELDGRVVRLPGAVTCAFLPHTPHAARFASLADALGKEVMLHLPMQALDVPVQSDPGMLRLGMGRPEFVRAVREGLQSLPHVRGVNNHMGSLLTQSPLRMEWLMDELGRHEGLYFVDSFTTLRSVAWQVAAERRLPSARRDVFLDASRDPALIRIQFELLLERARENGVAVGIGHPYPETVAFLEERLAGFEDGDVDLVPMSELILRREALRPATDEAILAGEAQRRENVALVPGKAPPPGP